MSCIPKYLSDTKTCSNWPYLTPQNKIWILDVPFAHLGNSTSHGTSHGIASVTRFCHAGCAAKQLLRGLRALEKPTGDGFILNIIYIYVLYNVYIMVTHIYLRCIESVYFLHIYLSAYIYIYILGWVETATTPRWIYSHKIRACSPGWSPGWSCRWGRLGDHQ